MKTRYLQSVIEQDLKTKMVFLAGPRQVGKTTLAKMTAKGYSQPVYLNWDNPDHRQKIAKDGFLILSPRPSYRLKDLLVQVSQENLHEEIRSGDRTGREEW